MKGIKEETDCIAKITVTYEFKNQMKGANDFNNLRELKNWLDSNPFIAEKLGYTKKNK